MFEAPSVFFSMVGIVYGLILPLVILHLIAVLFIPVMVSGTGAKVVGSGRAIYCYLLQALGVLLMTLGGLPAVYGVLAREPYDSSTYLALLIVFSAGGLTFLWHDHLVRTVDSASRSVPHAIYFFTFKVIGYLLTLLSRRVAAPHHAPWHPGSPGQLVGDAGAPPLLRTPPLVVHPSGQRSHK